MIHLSGLKTVSWKTNTPTLENGMQLSHAYLLVMLLQSHCRMRRPIKHKQKRRNTKTRYNQGNCTLQNPETNIFFFFTIPSYEDSRRPFRELRCSYETSLILAMKFPGKLLNAVIDSDTLPVHLEEKWIKILIWHSCRIRCIFVAHLIPFSGHLQERNCLRFLKKLPARIHKM